MTRPSRREAPPARGLPSARQATLAVAGAQTGSRDGYIEHERLFCKIVWGVSSPLLLNIALHGMEAALGVRHDAQGTSRGKRAVVRYADDFVVFCETEEDALDVKDRILPAWLAERGLSLSSEKTRIVRLTEGFDFLSFHVRHYPHPQTARSGYKLCIKPSKKVVLGKVAELRDE